MGSHRGDELPHWATITFGVLYCFFVIAHSRRRILHLNVASIRRACGPSSSCGKSFRLNQLPRHLIFDRDARMGRRFRSRWISDDRPLADLELLQQVTYCHFPFANLNVSFLANRRFSSGVWSGLAKGTWGSHYSEELFFFWRERKRLQIYGQNVEAVRPDHG